MDKFKLQIPTTIFFGTGEFERTGKIIRDYGKNAILVIGQGSVKKYGYLDKLTEQLKKENIKYTLFEGIEPNPRSSTINKGSKLASDIKADMVIALGGGSVMDAAKGIAVSAVTGIDVWEYCDFGLRKPKEIEYALPIICIPTLSATGSEVDGASVITNWELKRKAGIHNGKIIPKLAILDPELTNTVPANYLIDGAVDIICHCLETYLSNKNKVRVPDYITLGLVRTVKEVIDELGDDPKSIKAREDLCWASSVAMIGILRGRNGSWPIHQMEHAVSAVYDISHGLGLAWLLPASLEFALKFNKEKILQLVGFMLHGDINKYKDGDIAISDIKKWLNSIGAVRDFKACGINKIDTELVAKIVMETSANSSGYLPNAIPMSTEDVLAILNKTFRY